LETFQQAYLKAQLELAALRSGAGVWFRQWLLLHAPAPIISMAVRVRRWLRQRG
jgi:hypothetical protein